MRFQSYIYVTTQGCEDRDAAFAVMDAIADRLADIAERRDGLGWQVIPLVEPISYEEFDVDRDLLESITGGRLPAVNVNLSFNLDRGPDSDQEVDVLLRQYGLILAARIPD
jgi:hypothetical protein